MNWSYMIRKLSRNYRGHDLKFIFFYSHYVQLSDMYITVRSLFLSLIFDWISFSLSIVLFTSVLLLINKETAYCMDYLWY